MTLFHHSCSTPSPRDEQGGELVVATRTTYIICKLTRTYRAVRSQDKHCCLGVELPAIIDEDAQWAKYSKDLASAARRGSYTYVYA